MTKAQMEQRLIRYKDLIPCKNAFVDTRTPGSDQKENFTLIGPGVSENPNQHVHFSEPHGFNIGGARQPAGCLNSQHSHLSAEVFLVHTGKWKMIFGVDADEGSVEMNEGDVISIPPNMFRGFENIGDNVGFLYAVLGRDNPGKVTWAPSVFKLAEKYGLKLLKNGRLIDTTIGETVPDNAELETPPTKDEIENRLALPSADKLSKCVATYANMKPNENSLLATKNVNEASVILPAKAEDGFDSGCIEPWWEHEFHFRRLDLNQNAKVKWHKRLEEEVIFVHSGSFTIAWKNNESEECLTLGKGDTLSVPKGLIRSFSNTTSEDATLFVTRGGNSPKAPIFV